MKKYETLEMQIIVFAVRDVITVSPNESVDDLGSWQGDWLAQGNG